jgi:hypothetical protein
MSDCAAFIRNPFEANEYQKNPAAYDKAYSACLEDKDYMLK